MKTKHTEQLADLRNRAANIQFPQNMIMGAATASYQIEGAVNEDGRGESIWDRFSHTPGTIHNGENGDIACDHYHRWPEDIKLLKDLGLDAYRFSIAWPRILPQGRGQINQKGLDFYNRLVDGLLEQGTIPFATLYHWDLPQILQDNGGGWLNREVIDDYLNYTDIVTRSLGDRVKNWTTFNELWTFTWWGYAFGEDAPGHKGGPKGALAAGHHALVAHGKAVPIIRNNVPDANVGIVLDLNPVTPASNSPDDLAAAERFDGCQNRWYLDALYKGSYPQDMLDVFGKEAPDVHPGDFDDITTPIDYLGVNVYRRSIIKDGTDLAPVNFARVEPEGQYTSIGWEVWPEALYDILDYVNTNYAPKALYITENGAAFADAPEEDGSIIDPERSNYMVAHLEQAKRAMDNGVPLKGYFAWTLMDNFEWACGYSQRFGLVHIDYPTQKRTIKTSGELYRLISTIRADSMTTAS